MPKLVTHNVRLHALFLFWILSLTSLLAATSRPPNILIILADDMGFSDAGCYGGEIETPNVDRLAAKGLRFTQFYNTARCWPTRSALLSGYYPQQIRMDPPRGRLPEWARLIPRHLRPLGYRSYHSGKWHVSGAPKALADGGFDRSYRLEDHDRNFYPTNHWLDDVRLPTVSKGSNYYTTIAFADFMIQCLKDHQAQFQDRPFFGYLAFTVPHFPLQALPEDIARYKNKYREGWDVVREKRYSRQLRSGIVNCALSPREAAEVPYWNLTETNLKAAISPAEVARSVGWTELTDAEKDFQATKMAIHAAMIDRMDREIGRVLDQLKAMGAFENTVIMFASDNGASAEFLNRGDKHDPNASPGSGGSFLCLGPGWSTTCNTPFRLHKSWVHEGGISTPLIVHWSNGIKREGELRHAPGHVIDVLPTVLELAGGPPFHPNSDGPRLSGRSLVPIFDEDRTGPRHQFLYFHHENNHALRIGDWKLVSKRPFTNDYALYNLKLDRAEQINLAAREPQRLTQMSNLWQKIETTFREEKDFSPATLSQ